MQSRWVDRDAKAAVDRYAAAGISPELALRVYTTRLLGGDPKLVLHGGGNTSVKLRMPDLLGQDTEVLCVKGSGSDMAVIEPAGLPAVRLPALHQLLARDEVSDEDMVRVQRANLLDPMAPNPSVETLLHAFLPHKFVDHTHANAVVSLVDQENSAELCQEVYGARMGFVPYVMPGFQLAKVAAAVFKRDPKVEGFILDKHGIFTFGESAREAYERMIEAVTLAETRLQKNRKAVFVSAQMPQQVPPHDVIAPLVRGACSIKDGSLEGAWRRLDPRFPRQRRDPQFRQRQGRGALQPGRCRHAGHHHPDQEHTAPAPAAGCGQDRGIRAGHARRRIGLHGQLQGLFRPSERPRRRHQNDARSAAACRAGAGARTVRLGRSKKDAAIAADLAEAAIECITDAEAIGRFRSISEDDMFDVEYWSWSRPSSARPNRCRSRVRSWSITGAGGAIGAATAKAFAAAGAEVALMDIDHAAAQKAARRSARRRRGALRRHRDSVKMAFDNRAGIRRRRHRRIERRRCVARPHRRGGRSDVA